MVTTGSIDVQGDHTMSSRFSLVLTVFVVSLGLTGCGDTGPAPAESSSSNPTAITDPATDETVGVGEEATPEGNTEPPLTDVTDAVGALPTAGSPEVTLVAVTPQEFDAAVAKHKGKVVFVDFWATWCVPCRKAFPKTVAVAKEHPSDLVVISMSFDDPEARPDALEFLTEQQATFENLMCSLGGGDESFSAYDIGDAGLPYFRLYDRNGDLVQVFKNDVEAGKGVDEAQVHHAIEALLAKK